MPVMTIEICILKMIKPIKTPMILKTTCVRMITVFPMELNCVTRIKNINPSETSMAIERKLEDSFWSSLSPVILISIPSFALNLLIAAVTFPTTSLGVNPLRTLEERVTILFRFFLLMPP